MSTQGVAPVQIDGTAHDFAVTVFGKRIANVWHSDKSEWTVEFVDGPVHRTRTRNEAIALARRLA